MAREIDWLRRFETHSLGAAQPFRGVVRDVKVEELLAQGLAPRRPLVASFKATATRLLPRRA
ncbi:MAG TPA: hypothetical protein VF101_06745 [Gaiellaceae bacterium]